MGPSLLQVKERNSRTQSIGHLDAVPSHRPSQNGILSAQNLFRNQLIQTSPRTDGETGAQKDSRSQVHAASIGQDSCLSDLQTSFIATAHAVSAAGGPHICPEDSVLFLEEEKLLWGQGEGDSPGGHFPKYRDSSPQLSEIGLTAGPSGP